MFPLHICRPNDYTIEIIFLVQIQIYNILLMFFPLFSNVFTNILKIYELPKIYNKILKKLFTIIIYQVNYVTISSGFWTLLKMYTWWQKTLSALNLQNPRWDIFLKNAVPKESFFFAASDVARILYNKPCICIGD